MLAGRQAGVEQGPELGALGLGLPLAEAVAVAEDAFLGAGLFLVTAGAADECIEAELLDGFEQCDRLVHVAAFARVGQAHGAARHRVLHAAHDQFGVQLLRAGVAEIGDFHEVVTGVDHQQRVGDATRAESLFGALEHHQRVLAAGEQQRRALEARGHLAQDEDGLLFERVQVGVAQVVGVRRLGREGRGRFKQLGFGTGVHAGAPSLVFTCNPHSLAASSSHHQRPARKSSPRLMARVQGAQPMLGKNWSCSGL
ncbi:MAG: hypothetical protein BWX79_00880 [Alphaproteobacteria bacterium ADurb.Bin100]|nr:MAG: hypothetical protein BWX79_00880 [Alphaproteobacteria bacterium ADurb.Bin100]